ncbi:CTP synthase [Spirochaeta thermophila DSM 6578]|uniref:CTP synthase n=1 Tax=Winmispira thermophila (strain ATCC 700085 / DSM 6578 / Z-1203) TaxID=869211 RepID=G0GG15_WINT7|nr:CTP synthase [Spirochaeta thermophila]AEJ62491.1 CTP synthase [Spirochaeta thermophila DSM 6578]
MGKYIFVTGGVCSSLGKGIAAASIGSLLELQGLTVRMIKIDPYLNVDAGTMSPYQHGEVYVTDDGAETDLDLGNYARFTNSPLSRANSITTGQIYMDVIQMEREGRFLGRTVQVIPHITDRIKHRIKAIGDEEGVDVTIVEIGGTVGDIESFPFLEAVRQIIHEKGHRNALSVHLTLVPLVSGGELKTKPTQHSVKELLGLGIQPDILLCRAPMPLDEPLRKKISLFTNVEPRAVISAYDVPHTIYEIPLSFHKQDLDTIILEKLDIPVKTPDLSAWEQVVDILVNAKESVTIGFVGKYIELGDAYKSVDEALYHGGVANEVRVVLKKIDAESLEKTEDLDNAFKDVDAIIVPGGFGQRGIEGMIRAAEYARTRNIPYLGICLGMQVMVIEFARNVLGLKDADSTEFTPTTPHPVVSLLEEQVDITMMGGTMRLGAYEAELMPGSLLRSLYGVETIQERHRHRYEFSNQYREQFSSSGMRIAAVYRANNLVEGVEWEGHPWGIGVQFHPEFKSKPLAPHPLFSSFIRAALDYKHSKKQKELFE